jgi:hypothetical protein
MMRISGSGWVPTFGIVVAGCLVAAGSADAQRAKSVRQAFAAVQAPESAVEVCLSASVQAALDCARKRCERKAGRGACFAVTACEPGGWAGIMGVQMSEVHFSNAVCGAPTREAAIAALKAFCEGHVGAKQCGIPNLWSPDGKQHDIQLSWAPSGSKK